MPFSVPKPALDITISVRWDGGDRVFNMALTHEAILQSSTGDALLAMKLQEIVKVPFEYWRRLEVQIAHVWNSGQSQEIYSHSSNTDYATTQEQVTQLLSWWQQFACLETRSVRMLLVLDIDISGVHLLPPRGKQSSLTQSTADALLLSKTLQSTLSPKSQKKTFFSGQETDDHESEAIMKTEVYENVSCLDEKKKESGEELVPDTHIQYDRSQGMWKKIIFTGSRENLLKIDTKTTY